MQTQIVNLIKKYKKAEKEAAKLWDAIDGKNENMPMAYLAKSAYSKGIFCALLYPYDPCSPIRLYI